MSADVPPVEDTSTTALPLVAGRYRLLEKLGEGGMGEVWQACDTSLDRLVAVKLLPTAKGYEADAVARFRREGRALARLSHPGIVKAFDSGEDDRRYFLVMELLEGRTLADILRQGPIAPARAADYIYQAALALEHAHAAGLVHRDLKPSNLLLGSDGQTRLLDLGLARFLQDQLGEGQLTQTGTGLGTPDYAPPEQFRDAHSADPRSDIYSLGCTLYHLLAGRVPFPGSSLSEKAKAHQTAEPTPLEELCPDLPGGLALVVRRMMAKRPADRFQSPREVAEALSPFVAGSSASFAQIKETTNWSGSQLTMRLKRRRWPWPLIGAAALLLVALPVTLALWPWRPPEEQPAPSGGPAVLPTVHDDPNVLTVSQEEKGGGRFRTIGAALDEVKSGQTIRVLDSAVYRERLRITDRDRHSRIVLESPRRAVLARPSGQGGAPAPGQMDNLVVIRDVSGVTLRGFRILVDRAGPRDVDGTQVYLMGITSGTLLEDLHVEDRAGNNCHGIELSKRQHPARLAEPVIVRNCEFRGVNWGVLVGGVAPDLKGDDPIGDIAVRDNLFDNCVVGILAAGAIHHTQVVGNRIRGTRVAGVQLLMLSGPSSAVLVANNTMIDCREALRVWDAKIPCRDVEVCNNLFLQSHVAGDLFHYKGTTFQASEGLGDGLSVLKAWRLHHNWREGKPPKEKAGWIPLGPSDVMQERIEVLSRDPSSSDYLRPSKDSPLATGGVGKDDPSLPRYVGAAPPVKDQPWDWEKTWRTWKSSQARKKP